MDVDKKQMQKITKKIVTIKMKKNWITTKN